MKGSNQASLTGEEEASRTLEEGLKICTLLESYGYDALSVDVGVYDSFHYTCSPCYMPRRPWAEAVCGSQKDRGDSNSGGFPDG